MRRVKFGCDHCPWTGKVSALTGDGLGIIYARARAKHDQESRECPKLKEAPCQSTK